MCVSEVQVGSPDGRFDVTKDEDGVITVTDVTTSNVLTLPYHNDRFYFKDVTTQSLVIDMEDLRVVFYSSGYVRVDADTGVFYSLVSGSLRFNTNYLIKKLSFGACTLLPSW